MYPICGEFPRTGSPFKRISPVCGFISPQISESRVDLPQPDGPTTAANSPGAREKERLDKALVSPWDVW